MSRSPSSMNGPSASSRVQFEDEDDRRRLRVELDAPLGASEERLVEELAALDGVLAVRWTE